MTSTSSSLSKLSEIESVVASLSPLRRALSSSVEEIAALAQQAEEARSASPILARCRKLVYTLKVEEDGVVRLQMKLDAVHSGRDEGVRVRRKQAHRELGALSEEFQNAVKDVNAIAKRTEEVFQQQQKDKNRSKSKNKRTKNDDNEQQEEDDQDHSESGIEDEEYSESGIEDEAESESGIEDEEYSESGIEDEADSESGIEDALVKHSGSDDATPVKPRVASTPMAKGSTVRFAPGTKQREARRRRVRRRRRRVRRSVDNDLVGGVYDTLSCLFANSEPQHQHQHHQQHRTTMDYLPHPVASVPHGVTTGTSAAIYSAPSSVRGSNGLNGSVNQSMSASMVFSSSSSVGYNSDRSGNVSGILTKSAADASRQSFYASNTASDRSVSKSIIQCPGTHVVADPSRAISSSSSSVSMSLSYHQSINQNQRTIK
eukprot:TRINITY_DN65873_c5_g2_i2.p1 TRINITY_DN65873_c5_g2~~TRINITY_DN65873_c5_g2_i2.p1  ORF type:complete len:431 (-),score=177.70 TRINITY_DN65873_c5_g2_i2:286-1578(-)